MINSSTTIAAEPPAPWTASSFAVGGALIWWIAFGFGLVVVVGRTKGVSKSSRSSFSSEATH